LEAIQRVTETQRYFLIGVSKTVFWTIPKHAIPDESTLIALRKLFESNVQGRLLLFSQNT